MREVVCDKHYETEPLQLARGVHPEDQHEAKQLHQQSRLQDRVVPKETDAPVAVVVYRLANLLRGAVQT